VFPLAPEPIRSEDGARKNDCGRRAATRLPDDLRREHPQMKAIVVEDGPASSGPHILHLMDRNLRFILGAKPGDHALPFSRFEAGGTRRTWRRRDADGTEHHFDRDHDLPLDDAHLGLKVNMLHHREIDTKGNVKVFPWITDLPLDRDTVMSVMRAARSRRVGENETFRTLEARDACRFGHDFGHGRNHPADVFATLAMPAFPTDRVQRHCRPLFRKARDHRKRILHLRDRMRSLFRTSVIRDRRTLYLAMAGNTGRPEPAEPLRGGPWPAGPSGHARTVPIPLRTRHSRNGPSTGPARRRAHTKRHRRANPRERASAAGSSSYQELLFDYLQSLKSGYFHATCRHEYRLESCHAAYTLRGGRTVRASQDRRRSAYLCRGGRDDGWFERGCPATPRTDPGGRDSAPPA